MQWTHFGRSRSPHTVLAVGVRGGHCSGYSVSARTNGELMLGGDLNDPPLELVSEVWSHEQLPV